MILVVDDNIEIAESHALMLRELGYQAVVETDPEKAEVQISNCPEIQMALLDVQMPKMDGIELLRRIKLRNPQVGVVMATVINDIEKAVMATKRGAYNYLLKPLKPERLKM